MKAIVVILVLVIVAVGAFFLFRKGGALSSTPIGAGNAVSGQRREITLVPVEGGLSAIAAFVTKS